MRVLVRLDLDSSSDGGGVTKLLRIENSGVNFAVLLQVIANKLGVAATEGAWELYLEGGGGKKALVEDASEIDDGDTLVLCPSHGPAVAVKSEEGIGKDAPVASKDGDDASVETVPYELPKEVEVIEISSDDSSTEEEQSEDEDDDDDDDDDEMYGTTSIEDHESNDNEKPKAKNAGTNTDTSSTKPARRKGSKPKDPHCRCT